jgi:diguanylate cyclase (GGDEF)-like protein
MAETKNVTAELLALTERLSEPAPLEDALRTVTEAALRLLPGDHASVRLLDESKRELLASARAGKGTEVGSLALGRGAGVAGWVVENRAAVIIDDVTSDARFVPAMGQGFTIRSMLAEPLWSGGRVIGVLGVSSAGVGAFTPRDALLARLLANACVGPIERVRFDRAAAVDELTLASTADSVIPRIEGEMVRLHGSGRAFSVLELALDAFAASVQSYGREIADRVLCVFSDRVRAATRVFDAFARVDESNFTVVLSGIENDRARRIAERLRAAVGDVAMEPFEGGMLTQTVSIGLATWNGSETAPVLRTRAETALAHAIEQGGNRVQTV